MTWDNITIGQYYKIQDEVEAWEHPIKKGVAPLVILSGYTMDELLDMEASKLAKLQDKYDFIRQRMKPKTITKWNGYKIEARINKLTAGQYIDIDSIRKEKGENKYHQYMAILAKGEIDDFEKKAEYFRKEMPITVAMGTASFFLQQWQKYQQLIQHSLTKEMQKMEKQLKRLTRS